MQLLIGYQADEVVGDLLQIFLFGTFAGRQPFLQQQPDIGQCDIGAAEAVDFLSLDFSDDHGHWIDDRRFLRQDNNERW